MKLRCTKNVAKAAAKAGISSVSAYRIEARAENPTVLRRMALSLLKRKKTHKAGIEAKRCRAG